jgi:hypothetical protein
VSPKHSISFCPICGGGLCGVRICGITATHAQPPPQRQIHGLIVCDECEAVWLEPDLESDHQYPDAVDARCPICDEPLWGPQSRWADRNDIADLGWASRVDHQLDRIDT